MPYYTDCGHICTWVPGLPLLYTLHIIHLATLQASQRIYTTGQLMYACMRSHVPEGCGDICFTPLSPLALGMHTEGTSCLYSDQATRSWSESPTDPRLAHRANTPFKSTQLDTQARSGQTISSENKSGISRWFWLLADVVVAIQMWGSSWMYTGGRRRLRDETNISAHFGYTRLAYTAYTPLACVHIKNT